jgi:uncharacterized protein
MSTTKRPALGLGRQPAFEHKAFRLEIKDVTATGQFQGYAAVFGNVDQQDDVIVRGAFAKTIMENAGLGWPILWQHDAYEPIGLIEQADEEDPGLDVIGQLNMDVQRGAEAHSLLRQKAVRGMSIGYSAVQQTFDGLVRFLREVKLREVSLATFPANELALVDTVKHAADVWALVGQVKAGRVLSKTNFDALEAVVDELSALLAAAALEPDADDEAATDDGKSSSRGEPATEATLDVKTLGPDALTRALAGLTTIEKG